MPATQIVRIVLGGEKTTKSKQAKKKYKKKKRQTTNRNKQTKTQYSVSSQQFSSLINITAI